MSTTETQKPLLLGQRLKKDVKDAEGSKRAQAQEDAAGDPVRERLYSEFFQQYDRHHHRLRAGNVVAWSSAGKKGFKGARKSTPFAAQVAAEDAAKMAVDQGVRSLSVYVNGPGAGRETALRGLQVAGLKISYIRDITPIPHNGCRPPKRRRV